MSQRSPAWWSTDEDVHPVLRVVFERARAGSRPGQRDDPHVVCLAVEGGGMRGAVTAGMCVQLEAAGLIAGFDRIYGVSAGALNGAYAAAGQAARSAQIYRNAATRRCINPWRGLARRPIVDLDYLFGNLIERRCPITPASGEGRPEFRALATSLDTLTLRVLGDFDRPGELMRAVRASATIPTLCGPPTTFRGEAMIDGAVLEAIPFRTALQEGATHVLVLRSRPAGFRVSRERGRLERAALQHQRGLRGLQSVPADAYNYDAEQLQRPSCSDLGRSVLQSAVPDGAPLIGRLERSSRRVAEGLTLGAAAITTLLKSDPVESLLDQTPRYAAPGNAAPAWALGS